jgi:sec-independent protein translocase protein TatA
MQVYFLFLESLGTPEMILIALVALIIFGPRKLPTIGRTIGKYTAEFKRASREFRDTFEREVELAELEEKQTIAPVAKNVETVNDFNSVENTIGRSSARRITTMQNEDNFAPITENNFVALPEISAVNQADFAIQPKNSDLTEAASVAEAAENIMPRSKREWL